MTDCMFAILYV